MKSIVTLRGLNRGLLAASVVAAVTGLAATAQAQSLAYSQGTPPSTQAMEWSGRSVARTGATVPNPGTAKIGPQTELEWRAQERSSRVIRTICTGCL